MATVTSDTSLRVDDDTFINHRQGSGRTNVDAFPATNARIDQKDRSLALLLYLPANIVTENKGNDQGVDETGALLHFDTDVITLYQLFSRESRVGGGFVSQSSPNSLSNNRHK
jgi:hypothetical protein